jgi:haloalkane dehalogenase
MQMKKINVRDTFMSYVDDGSGRDVLFLHGNPTSSYLWRNVIPGVSDASRCIAPDLIGFGDSGRPECEYRFRDHAKYLETFIDELQLDQVVLVMHDWGSALGLDWARRHSDRVRGLVLMEFIVPKPTWLDMSPASAELFQAFRSEAAGRRLLIEENVFIEKVLPGSVVRELSSEEMQAYRRPFLQPCDREPIFRFPNELPIAGAPNDVWAAASAWREWLLETKIPKLFFWADPGALISPQQAAWFMNHLSCCKSVELGLGRHYLPEDHAQRISSEIAAWLETLKS